MAGCRLQATGDFTDTSTELAPPVFLMLHVFSAARPQERHRRDYYRQYSPLHAIPEAVRHLFEIKFVLGRASTPEQERDIDLEQELYGDLIRLDGLYEGENMDHGKTLRWIRYVGRPGGRKAWWVLKCDGDTLPIIPNLLDWLTSLDPKAPTYVGTTLQRDRRFPQYMNGFLYGFSWGVIKAIGTADLTADDLDFPTFEDARSGEVMFSLPSKPGEPPEPSPDEVYDTRPRISPDPRTGLIRVDAGERMADFNMGCRADAYSALAWHRMKNGDDFARTYHDVVYAFRVKDRSYIWEIPAGFQQYTSTCL